MQLQVEETTRTSVSIYFNFRGSKTFFFFGNISEWFAYSPWIFTWECTMYHKYQTRVMCWVFLTWLTTCHEFDIFGPWCSLPYEAQKSLWQSMNKKWNKKSEIFPKIFVIGSGGFGKISENFRPAARVRTTSSTCFRFWDCIFPSGPQNYTLAHYRRP